MAEWFQDGAAFYRDDDGDMVTVVESPVRVADFDMVAAAKARVWFMSSGNLAKGDVLVGVS